MKVAGIMKENVQKGQWASARELFSNLRLIGKRLMEADRMNFTVGNVVKRVYHIIREECKSLKINLKERSSL